MIGFIPDDASNVGMTTKAECLEALQRAAERLEESPTKAQYEELGLTPASATIIRTEIDCCTVLCTNCHRAVHYESPTQ